MSGVRWRLDDPALAPCSLAPDPWLPVADDEVLAGGERVDLAVGAADRQQAAVEHRRRGDRLADRVGPAQRAGGALEAADVAVEAAVVDALRRDGGGGGDPPAVRSRPDPLAGAGIERVE